MQRSRKGLSATYSIDIVQFQNFPEELKKTTMSDRIADIWLAKMASPVVAETNIRDVQHRIKIQGPVSLTRDTNTKAVKLCAT
jgi:hypothetical protein